MPAWIHDRAQELKKKMVDQYGKEKGEQVAFAVATQQAHAVGKSPKTFVSKQTGQKERFGTPEGKAIAKAKFDKPKSEYKKTAALLPIMAQSMMLELEKIASRWKEVMRAGELGTAEKARLRTAGLLDQDKGLLGLVNRMRSLPQVVENPPSKTVLPGHGAYGAYGSFRRRIPEKTGSARYLE